MHETIPVNMNTLKLEVLRARDAALITKDRMRVDVQAEFYVRVKPDASAISTAAQTLGRRTMDPAALKELIEGKFVDALRAVAAGMSMEELHENRVEFAQKVQVAVSEDLHKNGLELESVSLTGLDQTAGKLLQSAERLRREGLTKLTQEIERRRKERNDVERDTKIAIELKNLETERQSLDIARDQEYARLAQDQEVKVRAAEAAAASRSSRPNAARRPKRPGSPRTRHRRSRDRQAPSRRTARHRARARRAHRAAGTRIAVAKSQEESAAKALADTALAKSVAAEEDVKTVRDTAVAERSKAVRLVQAREQAGRSDRDQGRGRSGEAGVHRPRRGPAHRGHG